MPPFTFEIIAHDKKSRARAGIIHTAHGNIETPYLVPVATRAAVIALEKEDIKNLKIQALLSNTYHLHMLGLDKKIKLYGSLHTFMHFNKPIITDSGGFQAFSLGWGKVHNARKLGFIPQQDNLNKILEKQDPKNRYALITEKGVKFRSVYDESWHFMSPKESMRIQSDLGADIIMAFDECTSPFSNKDYTKKAIERTHRWAHLSLKHHNPKQALYGIIQGGQYKDLRIRSAKYINALPFNGIAIGGSLGKTKKTMHDILDWIIPLLDGRPRHMLGIGWIEDIFECVERGIDTFDCVEMTRVARHGHLFISPNAGGSQENKFKLKLNQNKYAKDKRKIDRSCKCLACKKYNRAQLRKLFKSSDEKYKRLATIHNIHFMLTLCKNIRESIKQGTFQALKKKWIR